MHEFNELVTKAAQSSLSALSQSNLKIKESLHQSTATHLVKGLQIIQLQKAILAIGLFSIFEAELQRMLSCKNGFKECTRILIDDGESSLNNKFQIFVMAINVLKHGKGYSYDRLLKQYDSLPFKIKKLEQSFFFEGDVSEISTLIEVDDDFVLNCVELVNQVSAYLKEKVHDNGYQN